MNQNVHYQKSDNFMDGGSTNESLYMTSETFYDQIKVYDVRSRCSHIFKNYRTSIIITSTALALTLVISILVLSLLGIGNKGSSPPFYNQLIIVDSNQIKAYNLETKNVSVLKEVDNEILSLEVASETIYWIEKDIPSIKSFFQNLSNVEYTKKLKSQAFAFDHLTDKFYIIDKSAETVNVIDKEGKHGIVLSNIEKPHDIAIDVLEGVMFITQQLKSILRANLDGSNVVTIIPNAIVTAISIDIQKKKILWVESNGISWSDYDGKNTKRLTESQVVIKSLTFFENQLFWLLPAYLNHNASLWSCKLIDGVCKSYENHKISLQNPFSIKIHQNLDKAYYENQNICKNNKGNCSDFCLIIPGNKRSCACQVGYQLNLDYQFCRHTTEFLIYADNQYIRGTILNPKQKEAFTDAIIPTPYVTLFSSSIVDFEYDLKNDRLYLTDGRAIYETSIVTDRGQKIITIVKENYRIYDITFDWLSNNLYYSTDLKLKDGGETEIVAITPDKQNYFMKKKINNGTDNFFCPHSLFVEPSKGYLFFIRCGTEQYENFHRQDVSGTYVKNLHQFGTHKEMEIFALDQVEDRIYYFNSSGHYIYHTDFDFKNTELVDSYISIDNINSLYVYKEHMYVGNRSSIWRFDKKKGKNKTQILPKFDYNSVKNISGFKIVSVVTHLINAENLCAISRGGCEQFCFSQPIKTCACMDGKQLQEDGSCL